MRLLTVLLAATILSWPADTWPDVCRAEPGVPHVTGIDSDGDGVRDSQDNCPDCYNPSQANGGGGPFGDACRPAAEPEPPGLPRTTWGEYKPASPFRPRLFVRPYALAAISGNGGHRYSSAGVSLQLAGPIDGWKPDPSLPHYQLPPFWRYHAGVYADVRLTSPQGGLELGVDHRPLWWGWYARHLPEVTVGVQAHLIWFDHGRNDTRRPLALGVGLKVSFLQIVSLVPFAQTDLRNGGVWSYGALLGFDFKILDDLGVTAGR
jgi:hypothetical protein